MTRKRITHIPVYEYGEFKKFLTEEGDALCYRGDKFLGCFENSSIFSDLYISMSKEIVDNEYKICNLSNKLEQSTDIGVVTKLNEQLDEARELIRAGYIHLDTVYENEGVNGECSDWILKANEFLKKDGE